MRLWGLGVGKKEAGPKNPRVWLSLQKAGSVLQESPTTVRQRRLKYLQQLSWLGLLFISRKQQS